ncbi:MAG: hypothetical protein GY847_08860 [Proteobacteria bacterium]|nr:hypothetical protein [Pseudomonadota bacterium]
MRITRDTAVRMGGSPRGTDRRLLIAAGLGVAGIVAGLIIGAVICSPGEEDEEQTGCRNDDDCSHGTICAAGGCLILISSEHPMIWHEDVTNQLDAGVPWQPQPTFGEKLLMPDRCPASKGHVDKPKKDQITPLSKATVYEINSKNMTIYKHARKKGNVWVDSFRFWFSNPDVLDSATFCASKEIAHISSGKDHWKGKKAAYVGAALARAVPANTVSAAAISVRRDLPQPDAQGMRTLVFDLEAVSGGKARYHSIAVFPLGSDVTAIQGPPPTQQRLLIGFVAYYWEHGSSPSQVAVSYRVLTDARKTLDISKLNP